MIMQRFADIVWHRLVGLIPGELKQAELGWLVLPHLHVSLLARRRATMIVDRARLFAFLFAVLTPLWSLVDLLVFPLTLLESLVMASPILIAQASGGSLTGGFARRSADQITDWKALVDQADRRMYLAKQGGRDRVVGRLGTDEKPAAVLL